MVDSSFGRREVITKNIRGCENMAIFYLSSDVITKQRRLYLK